MNLSSGSGLIVSPHMDDAELACGGLLAMLPDKAAWHVVYAADGMGSPDPTLPWRDRITPDLGRIRKDEARHALTALGIPADNVRFLDLPDGRLHRCRPELFRALGDCMADVKPDRVLVPFRYDRHPDHLTVNRVATDLARTRAWRGDLVEYFVYSRWRLLPERDMRRYIRPSLLHKVEIASVAALKRQALDCHKSQTTRFYNWQDRPVLTSDLLDDVCGSPEFFLRYDASMPGTAVFERSVRRIRAIHVIEPWLHKTRNQWTSVWRRIRGSGRS